MDCEKIEAHISEFVDRQIGSRDRITLSDHLDRCPECRMKLADILRLRASIQFDRAMDPSPVADEFFASTVMSRIKEERVVARPVNETLAEKIRGVFSSIRPAWLVPAFVLVFFILLPVSMLWEQGNYATLPVSMSLENARNEVAPTTVHLARVLNKAPVRSGQSDWDEYLKYHWQNAEESGSTYPIIYASY